MEQETYHNKVSDRSDYFGSSLHAFHVLLEEIGLEAMMSLPSKQLENMQGVIQNRINGHKVNSRYWTEEEKQFLVDNYLTMSASKIALKLDKTIDSIVSMKSHMKLEGTMMKSWYNYSVSSRTLKSKSTSKKVNY